MGGWAILLDDELSSGWVANTTNNQMELYAVLQALEHCPANDTLEILTDSKLVIGWVRYGWAAHQKPIITLVQVIVEVWRLKGITLLFTKVKGHSGEPGNHLVDRAAVEESQIGHNAWKALHGMGTE